MGSHLDRILAGVREDLIDRKRRVRHAEAVRRACEAGLSADPLRAIPETPAILAEIKRASPSRGWIRRDLDAVSAASAYLSAGAWGISVLTESRCFGGSLRDLSEVRNAHPEAILMRKDFILDEYMLAESRAAGADLVLLMVSVLGKQTKEMVSIARRYGLEPLVETRNEAEIGIALSSDARLIGINNRDLETLAVDLSTAGRLLPLLPRTVYPVVESGISEPEQVRRFHAAGARIFLVGESLSSSADPADTIRRYVGECSRIPQTKESTR